MSMSLQIGQGIAARDVEILDVIEQTFRGKVTCGEKVGSMGGIECKLILG